MKRPVENSILGRLIRTVGYAGYAVSIAVYLVFLMYNLGFEQLSNVISPIMEFIIDKKLDDLFIVTIVHFGSLFLLIWCLSKNVPIKVIATVLLVYLYGSVVSRGQITSYGVTGLEAPEGLTSFLKPIFDGMNGLWSGLTLAIEFVALFFVWLIFAYKRPKRVATSLIHFAYFIGAFAAITVGIQTFANFEMNEVVLNICKYVFIVFQGIALIGAVFGVLGFMRK